MPCSRRGNRCLSSKGGSGEEPRAVQQINMVYLDLSDQPEDIHTSRKQPQLQSERVLKQKASLPHRGTAGDHVTGVQSMLSASFSEGLRQPASKPWPQDMHTHSCSSQPLLNSPTCPQYGIWLLEFSSQCHCLSHTGCVFAMQQSSTDFHVPTSPRPQR